MRLRWAFDFNGNRPTERGEWNNVDQEDDPVRQKKAAWRVRKNNLKTARIEGEMPDGSVQTLAEVDGVNFRNFEWIAEATIRVGVTTTKIVGLSLVSRNEVAEIFGNGSARVRKRNKDDQSYEGLK